MKALTLWQPWASLIMIGAKPFEFRGWDYRNRYRGLENEVIVIHAGARPVRHNEVFDLLKRLGGDDDLTGLVADKARPLLERMLAAHKCQLLPLGAGLGTVRLGRPRNAGAIFGGLPRDSDRGDFNYAWPLTEITPFDAPVPMRGAQGFWQWSGSIAA